VAHDVRLVERNAVLIGEPARELGARFVHRLRVPLARIRNVTLVLDTDRFGVETRVVPGDVAVVDHLRDLAIARAHDVVGGHIGRRVLEPRDAARVAALHGVDHDVVDLSRAARGSLIVAGISGAPFRARIAERLLHGAERVGRSVPAHLDRKARVVRPMPAAAEQLEHLVAERIAAIGREHRRPARIGPWLEALTLGFGCEQCGGRAHVRFGIARDAIDGEP
jgi:hypothetical protein